MCPGRRSSYRWWPAVVAIVVMAVLTVGCGNDDPADPGDPTDGPDIPNAGPGADAYLRGLEYANLHWECRPENLTASCSSAYQSHVAVGPQVGVCYDWGGYVTIEQFLQQIAAGYGAGSVASDGILSCTTGVDASGFVSRAWGVGHHTTQSIGTVSVPIDPANVAVGDIWVKPGNHVFMQGPSAGRNRFHVLHATTEAMKVLEQVVDSSFLVGYEPRRNKAWAWDLAYASVEGEVPAIRISEGFGVAARLAFSNASRPCFARDHATIVFMREGDIYTAHPDGTELFNVTNLAGIDGTSVSEPALSAAGDRIVFVRRAVVPAPIPIIELVDADGTNGRELIADGVEPAFSPDGSRIVFVRGGHLFTTDSAGADVSQLTFGVGVMRRDPSFALSGEVIAFASAPVVPEPTWSIATIVVTTGETTTIVSDGEDPVFSPDGRWLAFVRSGAIFAIRLATGELMRLTNGPADSHPTWQ